VTYLYGVNKNRKIYGNCKVLSPDGILMFRCDEKKANWYLNRSLAEIIDSYPLIIRLNFKPNGLGNHNKDWGLSEMYNKCVVCGCEELLTKHHVVPRLYRKYFPLEVKSHNFHDVLSMCINCHESYERYADELKLELSNQYKSPMNGELEKERRDIIKYSKISSTLLRGDINIPKERIKKMRNEIKSFFGIKRLTKSRLKTITEVKSNAIKKTHGKMVIDKIDDLQSFVEIWRSHFLEKMKPNYLPKKWSIKNNIYE
jgi:exonuclease 3'-5' domain-containing protein 2